MARLNDVHLYGIIKNIKFAQTEEGDVKSVRFNVETLRRKSANHETDDIPKKDKIIVFSKNKEMIEIVKEIKNKSCVEVFGQLVTRRVDSHMVCDKCGEEITVRTYVAYVHPTGINSSVDTLLIPERAKFL